MGNFSELFEGINVNEDIRQLTSCIISAEALTYTNMEGSANSIRRAMQHMHQNMARQNFDNAFDRARNYYSQLRINGRERGYHKGQFYLFRDELRSHAEKLNAERHGMTNPEGSTAHAMALLCYFVWYDERDTALNYAKKILNIYSIISGIIFHIGTYEHIRQVMTNTGTVVLLDNLEHLMVFYDFFKKLLGREDRTFYLEKIPFGDWEKMNQAKCVTTEHTDFEIIRNIYSRNNHARTEYAVISLYERHDNNINNNTFRLLQEIILSDTIRDELNLQISLENSMFSDDFGIIERTWQIINLTRQPKWLSDLIECDLLSDTERLSVSRDIGVMLNVLHNNGFYIRSLTDDSFVAVRRGDIWVPLLINFTETRNNHAAGGTLIEHARTYFRDDNPFCAPELYDGPAPNISNELWKKADAYSYGVLISQILTNEQKSDNGIRTSISVLTERTRQARCTLDESGIIPALNNLLGG